MLKPIRFLLDLNSSRLKTKVKNNVGKCSPVADTKNKILSLEDLYTTLPVARDEVWKRWNNKELRKKVEDFLGGDIPDAIRNSPRAVIARHIIRPDHEFLRFLDIVSTSGLRPLGWEYLKDKFFTVNKSKLCLGKLGFCESANYTENNSIHKKIINFKDKIEGQEICSIKTIWGENLVDFHHRLPQLIDIPNIQTIDASDWYKSKGKTAMENYKYFLALFVANGILFENFLVNEEEKKFTEDILIPSCNEIVNIFGLKPLIVPITSRKIENELFLSCYPYPVKKVVDKLTNNSLNNF